ncbi:MAG TPA: hypothetical protein VFG42_20270 [Baekduia sp.]|uniref:hypothetical protein n=1 Tax=Baekduia sp. TaxID=2600305 RepID=UPI002D76CC6A|nr:hypothetical protein [Baekduia sp.]HET6509142.1 hypothetical protein [Baekduia sp.]
MPDTTRRTAPTLITAPAALLLAATLAWASGPPRAHAAARAPLSWGARLPVDTADGLRSVACPTTTLCVAGANADTADGAVRIATTSTPGVAGGWTTTTVPVPAPSGGLVSTSCPTADLCVAVDGYGHVLSSTNPTGGAAAWRVDTLTTDGTHPRRFTSVSCPTVTRCVAIDGSNAVLTTATPASGNWSASGTGVTWGRVSCTATLCAATNGPNVFTTTTPAGGASAWSKATIVPSGSGGIAQGALSGVACIPTLCVTADAGSATTDSGTWSSTHPLDGASSWTKASNPTMDGLTCVQGSVSDLCAGWSSYGAYVTATTNPAGSSGDWVSTENVADPATSDHVADVSCPAVGLCVAVTTRGAAVVGTSGDSGGGDSPTGPTTEPPATTPTTPTTPSTTVGGSPGPATLPASGYPGAGLVGNDVYAVTGNAVSFALNSANDVTGSIAAATVSSYATTASRAATARAKRKPVRVGSARFTLKAHVTKRVRLVMSKPARRLLAAKRSLRVRVTITARTSAGVTKVRAEVVTLKLKRRR